MLSSLHRIINSFSPFLYPMCCVINACLILQKNKSFTTTKITTTTYCYYSYLKFLWGIGIINYILANTLTWPYHYKFHGRSFVCMCTKFISAAKIIRFYLKSSQLTETVGKTFSLRIQHKLFNFPLNRICVHHDKILGHVRFNILFIVEITFLLFYLYQVKNSV